MRALSAIVVLGLLLVSISGCVDQVVSTPEFEVAYDREAYSFFGVSTGLPIYARNSNFGDMTIDPLWYEVFTYENGQWVSQKSGGISVVVPASSVRSVNLPVSLSPLINKSTKIELRGKASVWSATKEFEQTLETRLYRK